MRYIDCRDMFLLNCSTYCAPDTIQHYLDNFSFFDKYLLSQAYPLDVDIEELTKVVFLGYIAYHRNRGVKNTSVRTYARAMKVFFRYCYNEGFMRENITLNVKFPKPDKSIIIPLSSERVQAIENYIYRGRLANRNIAIFHLMLDCGLRRSEVVNLNIEDISFLNKYITIIDSKNSKSRVVPLPDNVSNMIRKYLRLDNDDITRLGALFLDEHLRGRLSKKAIDNIFSRMKIVDKDLHPHLLRHTFGTSFILGGGSLEILRVLMGHETYDVTKEYLHIVNYCQVANFDIYKLDDIFFRVYNYNRG